MLSHSQFLSRQYLQSTFVEKNKPDKYNFGLKIHESWEKWTLMKCFSMRLGHFQQSIHGNLPILFMTIFWSRRDLNTQPPDLESGALPLRHEITKWNLIFIIQFAKLRSFQELVESNYNIDYINRFNFVFWKNNPEYSGYFLLSLRVFHCHKPWFPYCEPDSLCVAVVYNRRFCHSVCTRKYNVEPSIDDSVVECSSATRAARVRFPVDAF